MWLNLRTDYDLQLAMRALGKKLAKIEPVAEAALAIVEMLTRSNPSRIIAPSYEGWFEASGIAGILARTQAIPKQDRRKFLNDTLLFLQAADTGSVMISRNSRDLDFIVAIKRRRPRFFMTRAET